MSANTMRAASDGDAKGATIHVTGKWFEHCPADVADVVFRSSVSGSNWSEAKLRAEDSVKYIKKTVLQSRGEKLEPEDTRISGSSSVWSSVDVEDDEFASGGGPKAQYSVHINGADVHRVIEACSILKGKLGTSLRIEPVDVYVSAASQSQFSHQALLRAVEAAHTSAKDTTKCVGGSACQLTSMKEEITREQGCTGPGKAKCHEDTTSPAAKPQHQKGTRDWYGLIRKGSLKISVVVYCEYLVAFKCSPKPV